VVENRLGKFIFSLVPLRDKDQSHLIPHNSGYKLEWILAFWFFCFTAFPCAYRIRILKVPNSPRRTMLCQSWTQKRVFGFNADLNPSGLLFPHAYKLLFVKLRVNNSVWDWSISKINLDCSNTKTIVYHIKSASVTEHMWVHTR